MKLRLLTNSMLMVFSAMLISCSFVSCGGDDEDDDNTSYTLSESSKFVGFWETGVTYMNNGMSDVLRFILFEEGIMRFIENGSVKECNWNYSKNTGILATTANFHGINPQWEITIANTGSWSGLSLWKQDGTTHNATPGNYAGAPILILANTKWKHESGRVYEFTYRHYKQNQYLLYISCNGNSYQVSAKNVSYDSNNDELSFWSGAGGARFTLRHPFSRNKCKKMIVSDSYNADFITGTWTRVE